MFVNSLFLPKTIPAVNARSDENLKSTCEPVLVNVSRTIKPKINVYIKPRSTIQSDGRITERRIDVGLFWQLRLCVHPADDLPWGDAALLQFDLGKRAGCYLRECFV